MCCSTDDMRIRQADAVIYRRAHISRAISDRRHSAGCEKFEYSPWLTANLTVDRPPRGRYH